jgi:hypothetical protein
LARRALAETIAMNYFLAVRKGKGKRDLSSRLSLRVLTDFVAKKQARPLTSQV